MSMLFDFRFNCYHQLITSLKEAAYGMITFKEYYSAGENLPERLIILRHDVEERYENALRMAQIQYEYGMRGTYYFRMLPKHFQPEIVHQIAEMGHEIGYHYDDLSVCKGDYEKAILRFEKNLNQLRQIAPVESISMDGSPLSRYDNRDLWKKYKYQDFGILAEPYFDLDFNKIFYITDTGRRWDGDQFNVRDKPMAVSSRSAKGEKDPSTSLRVTIKKSNEAVSNPEFLKLHFHSTNDLIQSIEKGAFPKQAMLNFHPQRWNDQWLPWTKELLLQNAKNQVKRMIVRSKR